MNARTLAELKARHDEREAAEAASRKAAEEEKRKRVLAERAARAARPPTPLTAPGPSHKGKEAADKSAVVSPVQMARRKAEKEASRKAQHEHEQALSPVRYAGPCT